MLSLAIALDGAGWHPAAWRDESARPAELFTAGYWTDVIGLAERAIADFVTIDDSLGLQSDRFRGPDERTDRVRGRLEAALVACAVAPRTRHIGLVPTITTTHTEPFHVSIAVATLDFISGGRAGWQARISWRPDEARHFGIRAFAADPGDDHTDELFDEAADATTVVRQLWDSWEDDAIIRDVATGRYIDRARLHYIEFTGRWFSVKGPSITPRPPQGQPVVTALAHSTVPYQFAARAADVVFVTPADTAGVAPMIQEVRAAERAVGRAGEALRVHGDLVVFLAASRQAAQARKDQLDERAGREMRSDAAVFVGTPDDLVELMTAWAAAGLDGVRLRPGVVTRDLLEIVDRVVPALHRANLCRSEYASGNLRQRLDLPTVPNQFAAMGAAT